MAYCRVLLCNINKKSSCCNGGFLVISNKYLVTFHFLLAIYLLFLQRKSAVAYIERIHYDGSILLQRTKYK